MDELLLEYCPNGVEYKKVKEVYIRLKGTPITAGKMKEIENSDGEIKIFAGGKTVINAREKDIPKANITRVPAVLVQSRGIIDVVYYEKPFTFKNEMWAYTTDNKTSVKYLYYVLKNNIQQFRDAASGMGSLPQISLPVTEEFLIPVPPLEVQREIVRILDNFTELTARKKQYEYYRECILKNDCSVGEVKIGDVCDVMTGGEPPKDCIKGEISDADHPYAVWGNGKDIYGYSSSYRVDKDAVVISSIGANTGAVYFRKAYFTPIIRLKVLIPKTDRLNMRYLYHALSATKIESKSSSVPNMNAGEIKRLSIPFPSIQAQEKIVEVLDNFDAICSDLNIGLPAEIEARKKQYEFYRDKLLTFDIASTTIARQTDGLIRLFQYVFGIAIVRLDSIFDIKGGYTPSKSNKAYWENGTIPWFRMEDIRENGRVLNNAIQKINKSAVKKETFEENSIIVATSATIGEHALITVPFVCNQRFTCLTLKKTFRDILDMKYMFYHCFILDEWCKQNVNEGNFASVDMKRLGAYLFAIPSIQEQQHIVSTLDRFDALCNDISSGLPAEIEARQKQYEYYRDKLLTFREKAV
ncbi:MAG: restriction endonuclease subunit S [Bacteroides thetaiotaomicron]|nr:restriction endonuclease subunit S [Bacteroides thetaiotaomicron]